ncbi:hypothetical protein C0J52_28385 [Blattella germanica]|nr:hypothetical protein C0J52_28385 [Blattella germanica]
MLINLNFESHNLVIECHIQRKFPPPCPYLSSLGSVRGVSEFRVSSYLMRLAYTSLARSTNFETNGTWCILYLGANHRSHLGEK